MNIEDQVELLMQGTEYGDEELKKAMKAAIKWSVIQKKPKIQRN